MSAQLVGGGRQLVIDIEEAGGYPDLNVLADKVEQGHTDCFKSLCCYRLIADQIREQTKPPKPPEPTGLGAVVEDVNGEQWTRILAQAPRQWRYLHYQRAYSDIDVAKVLSEGVQP